LQQRTTRTLFTSTNMHRQRNLNISFRERDLSLLNELKRLSARDYVSTSGITIDLIKKGILYDEQTRTNRTETIISI
jgi:hypothetical protein